MCVCVRVNVYIVLFIINMIYFDTVFNEAQWHHTTKIRYINSTVTPGAS